MPRHAARSAQAANRMPDGSLLWICGVFEVIEAPVRLIYSW
jgi:hypothetical protein